MNGVVDLIYPVASIKNNVKGFQVQILIQNPNKALRPGIYRGQCSFICGRGHARMIATVRVVQPSEFEAWLATQKKQIAEANAAAQAARKKLSSQTGAGQVENP